MTMHTDLAAMIAMAAALSVLFGTMFGFGTYVMYQVLQYVPGENHATRGDKISAIGFAVFMTVLFTAFAMMPGTQMMQGIALGWGVGFGMCFVFLALSILQTLERAAQKRAREAESC